MNKKEVPEVSEVLAKASNEAVQQTTHDDIVRSMTEQVLARGDIPWDGYQRANLINQKELELIKKYGNKGEDVRRTLIVQDGETYAELFLELLLKINKEETFQYLLCLIDQLITEHPETVALFLRLSSRKAGFPLDPFLRILTRSSSDWFTNSKTSNILATLMSSSSDVSEQNVRFMCQWLRTQLRSNDDKDVENAVAALMKFLKRDDFRPLFAGEDGLLLLSTILKTKAKNYQLVYRTLFDLWMLTYNKNVAGQIASSKAISYIVEILKAQQKEKIVRLCLSTLVNCLNQGYNNEQMLDGGIMKPIELLTNKNWGDEDIISDLKTLKDDLEKNIVELSTFELYRKEVLSGNLEWSPVHRSEKFWKENSSKFEEENYKILVTLKGYLTSEVPNPLVTAVACYDIGEFARIHPRGRTIVQQLGIKIPLMILMEDKDLEVKKQALTAVQKLMVHNWEYLM